MIVSTVDTPEQVKKCKECLSLYREYRDQGVEADAFTVSGDVHFKHVLKVQRHLYVDGRNFYVNILRQDLSRILAQLESERCLSGYL